MKGFLNTYVSALCSIGLICACCSAGALELDKTVVASKVSEPLAVHISLSDVGDVGLLDIKAQNPSSTLYDAFDIEFTPAHKSLSYKLREDYNGHYWLIVETLDIIDNPYFIYLVQLRWPQGQIIKEQMVILDNTGEAPLSYKPLNLDVIAVSAVQDIEFADLPNIQNTQNDLSIVDIAVEGLPVTAPVNLQPPVAESVVAEPVVLEPVVVEPVVVEPVVVESVVVESVVVESDTVELHKYSLFSGSGEPLYMFLPVVTDEDITLDTLTVDVKVINNTIDAGSNVIIQSPRQAMVEIFTDYKLSDVVNIDLTLSYADKVVNKKLVIEIK